MLKSHKFDVGFCISFGFEVMIMKILKLPVVKWLTYQPDPILTLINRNPWDMSTNLPVVHFSPTMLHSLGHLHVLNRALNNAFGLATNFVYNHVAYPASRFSGDKDAALAHSKTLEDTVVGDGFIGIREQKQEAMNVESILPATRSASRMRDTKELHVPIEYD